MSSAKDSDALDIALRVARAITKIDFFGRGYEPYDEAEFSRRLPRQVLVSGETLVIKAPEDTVLRKLLWYRAGGEVSDKQWRDMCPSCASATTRSIALSSRPGPRA